MRQLARHALVLPRPADPQPDQLLHPVAVRLRLPHRAHLNAFSHLLLNARLLAVRYVLNARSLRQVPNPNPGSLKARSYATCGSRSTTPCA